MKRFEDIIADVEAIEIYNPQNPEITALEYDSRRIEAGACFFAVTGAASDGHNYICSAIERGAVAVVCQQLPEERNDEVSYIVVKDSNVAMAAMAASFYDHPSHELHLVGVTGTNGKTTTATLLYDMFTALGYRAGLISTVVYRIGEERIDSTHTTPDAIRLNAMMRRMVEAGCDYCFMEVSSHAAAQHRIAGLHFEGALFSNLTHDHLDYHGTYKEYIRAKRSFFDAMNVLDAIEFDGEVDINRAVISCPNLGSNDGLAIIISDFFTDSDWKKAVDFLTFKKKQVLLIQVMTPEELDPSYTGRMHLIDSESQGVDDLKNMLLKIDTSYQRAYEQALGEIREDLRSFCASRGADFISIGTDQPIEKVLFKELLKVGIMA